MDVAAAARARRVERRQAARRLALDARAALGVADGARELEPRRVDRARVDDVEAVHVVDGDGDLREDGERVVLLERPLGQQLLEELETVCA